MSVKQKIPNFEKPKHFILEHIPDILGSNFYGFERLKLVSSDGKIIVRYKNAGSLVLATFLDKEIQTIKNSSVIVSWEICPPYVFSVHDSDCLQLINTETNQSESHHYKTSLFPLKKTQAIFVKDDNIFCVASNGVIIFDQKNIKNVPREIPLVDCKNKSTRIIINVNSNFSGAMGANRLLLANNDVFQVWAISKEKNEMFMEFEGRNASSTIKYLNLWQFENTVVTYSRGTVALWQANQPKETSKNPREIKEDNLVTDVFIDDSFIITGDNTGNISLRQRVDGEKIYDLPSSESLNSSSRNSRPELLEFNLENKVNVLAKYGRWVFAACENGKLVIYDIMKDKSSPVAEYIAPRPSSITALMIDHATVLAAVKIRHVEGKKESKESKTKEKPEIIAWNPKLAGLEYYTETNKVGQDSIACILTWTLKQIITYIKDIEKEGEDITELSSTMDRLEDSINQTRRYPELAVQFFQAIRKLQASIDSYESLLEKLTQQGKLVRIFTSSRLRRDIEYQNSVVGTNVIELELRIKTTLERKASSSRIGEMASAAAVLVSPSQNAKPTSQTTPSQPIRQSMIQDVGGRDFWKRNYGDALHVLWANFVAALRLEFRNCTPSEEKLLKNILDYSNTGSISQYKFAEFLKGFGPFEHCISNVKLILSEPWFHGFLNGRESELLMKNQFEPDGTFLVRFSKSKPGSFALAFLKDGIVNHILIESFMPDGFKVLTQDSTTQAKLFKTLHDLILHYGFVLKYPFHSDLSSASWFHGDITTEETIELLKEKPVGTFLIRFSSKGTFAASFIDNSNQVRHVLIATEGKSNFVVDTGSGIVSFKSMQELVNFYTEKRVFLFPLITGEKS